MTKKLESTPQEPGGNEDPKLTTIGGTTSPAPELAGKASQADNPTPEVKSELQKDEAGVNTEQSTADTNEDPQLQELGGADVGTAPIPTGQNEPLEAAAVEQSTERDNTVYLLTQAINYLGWDTRFQEAAVDLATKLTNAIEQVSLANDIQAPTA